MRQFSVPPADSFCLLQEFKISASAHPGSEHIRSYMGDWHEPWACFYDERAFHALLCHYDMVSPLALNRKSVKFEYFYKDGVMDGDELFFFH